MIRPGDALPSVPRHNLKADLSVAAGRLSIGASATHASSQYLRGDEANLLPPIDGATVANLTGSYSFGSRVRLFGRITNLFNGDYATFGLLGEADEVLGDEFEDARFFSPGAPRAAWLGLEFSLP
jgi:outer membrane receptor protein involved in Fe transport